MFREKIFFTALLALTVTDTAMAQRQSQDSPPQPSTIDREAQGRRIDERLDRAWDQSNNQRSTAAMANLPRVRAALAKMWQRFGMSPQDAKAVAGTYRIADNDLVRPKSLYGKSDEEIAGMLQSALASKQYELANMLLIAYQRKRMSPAEEKADHSAH